MNHIRVPYSQLIPQSVNGLLAITKTVHESSLGNTLVDLINIRVSQMNGCLFCLDMHSKESKIHGERELRLLHLTAFQESPLFSPKEKAALHWAELLTQISKEGISDLEFEKVGEHFSAQELSELTFAIATINTWNRLGIAFRPTPGTMDKMLGLDKAGLN